MRLDIGNGCYTDILTKAYYIPGLPFNLWACEQAKFNSSVQYCSKDNTVRQMLDNSIIGYTKHVKGVPVVYTVDVTPDLEISSMSLAAVLALLQHQRLAHTGTHRRVRTENHSDLDYSDRKDYHCEACKLGKAKRIVSRDASMTAMLMEVLNICH